MKILIMVSLLLFICGLSYATLTTQEEAILKTLISKSESLIKIADTINYEKIPLEIAELKSQYSSKIQERDGLLKQEDIKNEANKKIIFDNYAIIINGIETQIEEKNNILNSIIP